MILHFLICLAIGASQPLSKVGGEAEAGQKGNNGGKDGDKEAVAETSQERSEGSNQTRENSGDKANNQDKQARQDREDRVKEGDELRSEAGDGDDGFDVRENNGNEGDNQVEDGVNITISDVKAGSASEGGDDLGEGVVHVLESGDGGIGTLVRSELAGINLVRNIL